MGIFTRKATLIFLLLLSLKSYSATIKGHVYDKSTKEQLVGSSVSVKSLNKGTVTELDGAFVIRDIAPGKYIVNISYLGYSVIDSAITIANDNDVIKLEIYLPAESHTINEVQITSKAYGGSDEYANRAEQKSISLVNILSANAIQISPDITVANVMQRISGVTMDKNSSGEGRYAVIRGMDKKYNTTLINGVKIPSPNDKDRYVPMDIFPAELLERLEVIKTLMPSMEGDGTGGVVNMVMKSAPSKLMVEAAIGAGYSDIFQNRDFMKFDAKGVAMKSPLETLGPNVSAVPSDFPYKNLVTSPVSSPVNSTGSFTIGNRFLKNKLGVILAGSYQDMYRGTNSNVCVQNATVPPASGPTDPMVQKFSDVLNRQYSSLMKRTGVEANVDYKINEKNSISLFAVYAQLNEFTVRSTIDSQLGAYSIHNYVGAFAISNETKTTQTLQAIYSVTVQGKHKILPNLSTDWSLVASEATRKSPDIATFSYTEGVTPNLTAQTIALTTPTVDNETREWTHNSDKDMTGYLNVHYISGLIPGLTKIDVGGLYRHKDRDNYYNSYTLKSLSDSGSNQQIYQSIPQSRFFFSTNGGFGNGSENGGTYTFTENISAYYVQLHYEIGKKIKLDGGARVENTDQNYLTSMPVNIAGKSGMYSYGDFLPSIQGKYEFNSKSALRLSYFKSVYRPSYADLVPFVDPNANELYPTQGNPNVQHTVVDNYDLRYELFPKGLDQVLIGVFYKSLSNPIEYGLIQQGFGSGEVFTPENETNKSGSSAARNAGVELVYRKFIGNFGVSFNYTYTNSEIQSLKRHYWHSSAGEFYDTVYPKRPLQGQAPHIGNLSFLYKDAKRGIEAQLALVYTGERIYSLSAYDGLDNWEKPTLNLDFSAQKKIGKRFTVYFKANNLLNTPFEVIIKQHNYGYSGTTLLPFQENSNYVTTQKDLYYRTFLIGMRFKL